MLAPEKRYRIESPCSAKHVVRSYLTLTLGDDPVFDADMLPGQPVGPAGNVASGIDIRHACLQEFVHHDAAIDSESRRLCKAG